MEHGEGGEVVPPVASFRVKRVVPVAGLASVRFSPSNSHIVSASADSVVRIWRTGGQTPVELRGHSLGVNDAAWSPDSRYVASCSDDTTICLWDTATSKQVFKSLRGHGNYVSSVAFSPSTDQLASGCFDEFVRVWDTRTGTCVRTLAAHSEPVTSVEWGCSGKLLASGSYDGLVRVWDAPSGQCVASLVEPGLPPVGSVRWSPNGAYILASYLDSSVRLWDVLRGKRVKTYTGHSNDTLAVTAAFAGAGADGARIVSGSEDGRVVLWDASSKRVVQELQHPQTVGEGERPLPVLAVDAARHGLDALVSATSGPQGSIAFWTDDSRGREWRWEDEMVV